jgi:DNA-binding MarR family transcriptional regulator
MGSRSAFDEYGFTFRFSLARVIPLDPEAQALSLDSKIIAGLLKLSEVVRVLMWEQAKASNLSPIQIQLLLFVSTHKPALSTISALAAEFNLTKATVSDSVRVLESKGLVVKAAHPSDARSQTIKLTPTGKKLLAQVDGVFDPLAQALAGFSSDAKAEHWATVSGLIWKLIQSGIITPQRMCWGCKHYAQQEAMGYCQLLQVPLKPEQIRLDCVEFEQAETAR